MQQWQRRWVRKFRHAYVLVSLKGRANVTTQSRVIKGWTSKNDWQITGQVAGSTQLRVYYSPNGSLQCLLYESPSKNKQSFAAQMTPPVIPNAFTSLFTCLGLFSKSFQRYLLQIQVLYRIILSNVILGDLWSPRISIRGLAHVQNHVFLIVSNGFMEFCVLFRFLSICFWWFLAI